MSTRCQANGGCDKEQAWHCHYLTMNGIYGRSLCEEHADIWMRANHDHGPWATPAVPLQVSKIVLEDGKAVVARDVDQ